MLQPLGKYFRISKSKKFGISIAVLILIISWLYFETTMIPSRMEDLLSDKFVQLLQVVSIMYLVVSLVRASIVGSYRIRNNYDNEYIDNFTLGTSAIVNTLTVLVIIASVFFIYDIPFREFLTSVALFGVAIAVLFRDYILNFFNALYVLFTSYFQINDWISQDGHTIGRITDFTFRYATVTTPKNTITHIPYTKLLDDSYTIHNRKKAWQATYGLPTLQNVPLAKIKKTIIAQLQKSDMPQLADRLEVHITILDHQETILTVTFSGPRISRNNFKELFSLCAEAVSKYAGQGVAIV